MILPVLPFVARRYGASALQVTALVSVFALAQFLLSPFIGALSDRVGRKPVLVVSLFGSALGSLVVGLAGALPLLFLGRAIDGMSGTALVSAQTAITDMVGPRDRARYLGLMGSAFAVGFIVGPGLSGLLSLVDQRLPFFVAAALAAGNAIVAIVRLPETRPPRLRAELQDAGAPGGEDANPVGVFRHARVVTPAAWFYIGVLALGLLAFAAIEGGTFTLLADDRLGLSQSSVAFIYVLIGLVLAAVQVSLVGPVNARLRTRGTVVAALLVNAGGFTLIAAAHSVWMLVLGVCCNAVGQGLLRPTCTAAVSNAVPGEHRGAAIGTQTSAQGLVRIVGPLEAGAFYGGVGPSAPFAVGAGIAVATAGMAAVAGRRFDSRVMPPAAPDASPSPNPA
jgi:MFS transporter, DHA1 family, tetracycline resistance protein